MTKEATGAKCSYQAISRIHGSHGIVNYRCAKPKEMLKKYFLEVSKSTGEGEGDIKRRWSAIQDCWDMILQEFFDALYQSMHRRARAYYKEAKE